MRSPGLGEIENYMYRRMNSVTQYIATGTNFDLCLDL